MGAVARYLRKKAEALSARREPDFVVKRAEGTYLKRWWIIPRNSYFNIYLHNMLGDDDDVLHDHMYASASLVLADGLIEVYREEPPHSELLTRRLREGQVIWRSSCMAHRLIVVKPSWTIFATGPRIKGWGFWCPQGFRHFSEYVKVRDGISTKGSGCE